MYLRETRSISYSMEEKIMRSRCGTFDKLSWIMLKFRSSVSFIISQIRTQQKSKKKLVEVFMRWIGIDKMAISLLFLHFGEIFFVLFLQLSNWKFWGASGLISVNHIITINHHRLPPIDTDYYDQHLSLASLYLPLSRIIIHFISLFLLSLLIIVGCCANVET